MSHLRPFKNPKSSDASPNNPEMGVLAVRVGEQFCVGDHVGHANQRVSGIRPNVFDIANAGNLDAYAVNEIGGVTDPRAATLPPPKTRCHRRKNWGLAACCDPGFHSNSNHKKLTRSSMPLTRAAASVVSGRSEGRLGNIVTMRG